MELLPRLLAKCQQRCGGIVKRKYILLYVLGDLFFSFGAAYFFVRVKFLRNFMLFIDFFPNFAIVTIYTLCIFLRVLIPLVGTIGVCWRKIRTTKVYFKMLPLQFGVTAWLLTSALRAQCSCAYDFNQCEIVVQISRDPIVNTCPRDLSQGGRVVMETFPSDPHPHKDVGETVNGDRRLVTLPPQGDHDEHENKISGRYLQEATDGRLRNISGRKLKSNEERIREAVENTCMCRGPNPLAKADRQSCYVFIDEKNIVRSWCPIATGLGGGTEACSKLQLHTSVKYHEWTKDLCQQKDAPRCACSTKPLRVPKSVELNPEVGNAKDYGSGCQKWHKADDKKWCFVSYDTGCSQREWVNSYWNGGKLALAEDVELDLDTIAQFRSSIPCQKDEVVHAQERCLLWKITITSWMILAELMSLPLASFIWVYLNNRCADHVKTTIQFDVNLDDLSDSDDDFDVRGSEDRPRKKRSSKRNQQLPRTSEEVEMAETGFSNRR